MTSAQWITMISAAIAAIAAIVNAVSIVVLVIITNRYAKSTAEILDESRKARQAAERQANAAQESISASIRQASAAQASVDLLHQQLEEQLGLGRGVIQSAIASAMSAISYWKSKPLSDVSRAGSLPPTDDLLPMNAVAAIEHARRISAEGAQFLSEAFDDLRLAKNEIERIKRVNQTMRTGFYDDKPSNAAAYLETAFSKVQKAQSFFL